jgi:hypothetical protein
VFLPPLQAAPPPAAVPDPVSVPADAELPDFDLGRFFRLLLARRRLDPGMDAESFLAWALAPGRRLRLADLDVPARRFLAGGGDQALDLTDRCLDLLDRLAEPVQDLAGVRLPDRFAAAARQEAGRGRPALRRAGTTVARIGLDPPGLHVILPACPDDGATWHLTADGDTATVHGRGVARHALTRPVRVVHVRLADSLTELEVVRPSDPILFFAEDGSRAAAASQLFGALGTPELTRAAQDAAPVIRSAARLVADSPYRRAAAQITARRLALPAMSLSLALAARIAARGLEPCRSFERTWRPRWTDLARQAPDLTSIDLVLAEAHIAAVERTRFT